MKRNVIAIRAERLDASYDLGVLTITIPVAEEAKPRRVEIAAQPSQPQPVGASTSRDSK